MIISHVDKLDAFKYTGDQVKEAYMKKLIGPEEGWGSHVMRVIELGSFGYSPKHAHPWPHINYVLEGEGSLFYDGIEHKLVKGSFAYVPQDMLHQFTNTTSEPFKFICVVPKEGHK
jgi:quercetin dioxygenase-like cupin family protein